MPISIRAQITGLPDQIQRFKNAELNLQAFEIGEIINWALDGVKMEAQSRAPVRTGTLRNSIINYMISDTAGECVVLAPYGAAVEFGYVAKGGKRVPGQNYFTPAAIHGAQMLTNELKLYVVKAYQGQRIQPKHAARTGGGKGSSSHKYLYKIQTGSGSKYVYSKKSTTVTSFRPLLYPGPGKTFPKQRSRRRSRTR
jgi:hypothetical protein